eukprot:7784967-Alexandrium_andersonii.AAC.1
MSDDSAVFLIYLTALSGASPGISSPPTPFKSNVCGYVPVSDGPEPDFVAGFANATNEYRRMRPSR